MQKDKNAYQAELLQNRITKNYRQLKKSMRKNRISCFRLYDKDIPEIPLAVDLYTFIPSSVHTKIDAAKHYSRLNDAVSNNLADQADFLKDEKRRTFAKIYLYEPNPLSSEDQEKAKEYFESKYSFSLEDIIE